MNHTVHYQHNPYSYLHNTISSYSQSHCQKENTLHTIDTNSFHFLYTHCQIHISHNYQNQMGWLWTSPLQLINEIYYTYSIHIERFPSHSTHHKPMKPHYRHTIHNYIPLNTLRIIPIPSISHTLITQQHQIPFQTYPHRYLSNSMERISDRITPYHTIHKSPLILLLTTSHSSYYTLSLHHHYHSTQYIHSYTTIPQTITLIHHTTLNPSTTHSLQSSLSLPLSPFYYYSTILTLQLHTFLHTTIHTLLYLLIIHSLLLSTTHLLSIPSFTYQYSHHTPYNITPLTNTIKHIPFKSSSFYTSHSLFNLITPSILLLPIITLLTNHKQHSILFHIPLSNLLHTSIIESPLTPSHFIQTHPILINNSIITLTSPSYYQTHTLLSIHIL